MKVDKIVYNRYREIDGNEEDAIEIKSYIPKIAMEDAIKIASKSFLKINKGEVNSIKLLYKPFSLFLYKALIRRRKHVDRPLEDIAMYIAIDMITGVGFESEALEFTTIKVGKRYVIEPLISIEEALNEVKKVILRYKAKIARHGLEVNEENITQLGLVYKPIWIIEFTTNKKRRYIGVDAVKGTRL